MWSMATELFSKYAGAGFIMAWFVICAVYLFVQEKDKGKRVLFLYVPIILVLLFFNPLFIRVIYGVIGEEIYYRVLWLLPVAIVIAYTIIKIYCRLRGRKAYAFLGLAAILVVISGSCIYFNPAFERAENIYHVPPEVVEICDAIEVEGREVMAVFPSEMIIYIRQYSARVCMPYGREMLVERWGLGNDLYDAMEDDVLDVEEISRLAKESQCHYVIINADKQLDGRFEDYDYIEIAKAGQYIVYQDMTVYIGLWDEEI